MSTTYGNLPVVPEDRWAHKILDSSAQDNDEGGTTIIIYTEVSALTAQSAEQRSLAVVDKDYLDDLRGAVAEATLSPDPDRWRVTITLTPVY